MNAKDVISKHPTASIVAVMLLLILASIPFFRNKGQEGDIEEIHAHEEEALFACPMLCVPPADKPGKCPVCGMNLERIDGGVAGLDKPVMALSEKSRAMLQVETAEAKRVPANASLRLSGMIAVDETAVIQIASRVNGRIDKLFADFTGKEVAKGEPLASIYSPDLISAQEELLQARSSGQANNIESAREKLKLLGVHEQQIAAIEKRGATQDHIDFLSPATGTILMKSAIEGSYIKEGSLLFSIADLRTVWAKIDVYESDLSLVRVGQIARLRVDTLPGRSWESQIEFVDPVLNRKTRTASVRLIVENDDLVLKPGMLARATVEVPINASGYPATADEDESLPLLIPASAPLITGERAVVYVETDNSGEYEGRNIQLGPRVGDAYVVLNGLNAGEKVVVKGNFRIDSALQIMGRPSMMMPESGDEQPEPESTAGGPQKFCPIMGGPINKDVYLDHGGYRIYFCCAGCDAAFRENADELLEKMLKEGIELEKTPVQE